MSDNFLYGIGVGVLSLLKRQVLSTSILIRGTFWFETLRIGALHRNPPPCPRACLG